VLLDDRDWDQAQAFHQQALDIRRQALESRPGSFQLEYDYSASHMKIGDMHYGRAIGSDLSADQAIDQMQLAKDWFLKGTALCAALVEAYPAEELQGVRQLAAFYERIADTCEGVEAHEHYMSSIQLKEQMAPKLAMDRNFQRDRAISWGRAARRLNENGEPEIARKHMRQCLDILQQLSQRIPDDTGLRIDEMMTWYQMGELLPPTSNQRQEAWQNALKIGNELIQSGHIKADFILFRQIKDMVEHQLEPIGESR
jgi:tetratricopeptide (TPR) repeat protein